MKGRFVAPLLLVVVFAAAIPAALADESANPSAATADAAEFSPSAAQRKEAERVFRLLRGAYKAKKPDDGLADRVFENLLTALDSRRELFADTDIQNLMPVRAQFREALAGQRIDPCYRVLAVFREKVRARAEFFAASASASGAAAAAGSPGISKMTATHSADDTAQWPSESERISRWRAQMDNDLASLKALGASEEEAKAALVKRYARQLPAAVGLAPTDTFNACMAAVVSVYDPDGEYLPPLVDEPVFAIERHLVGVGMVLRYNKEVDAIQILQAVPGGAAEKSGRIVPDDFIVAIAQGEGPFEDVVGMSLVAVVKMLRGPAGSVVRVRVARKVMPRIEMVDTVVMTRAETPLATQGVTLQTVQVKRSGVTHDVAVLRIPYFYRDFQAFDRGDPKAWSTRKDVARLLDDPRVVSAAGLVLDLRGNTGGSLAEAVDTAQLFIGNVPVAQVEFADGKIDPMTGSGARRYHEQTVVLVDEQTGAGAEIVAAALQDYRAAVVVGTATFGRASVQTLMPVGLGQLSRTAAALFRVDGSSFQNQGVLPDIHLAAESSADADRRRARNKAVHESIAHHTLDAAKYTPFSRSVDLGALRAAHDQRGTRSKMAADDASEKEAVLQAACEILVDLAAATSVQASTQESTQASKTAEQ